MKKAVFFILLAAVLVAIAKLAAGQKAEWEGLTEAQLREKLDARIPDRVPADKRSAVTDKVVATMRERGALVEESAADEPAADEPAATDSATDDGPSEAAAG